MKMRHMEKVLAVFDEPKECRECPCFNMEEQLCNLRQSETYPSNSPEWCPLIFVPEKYEIWEDGDTRDYELWYNACVRYVVGGTENE